MWSGDDYLELIVKAKSSKNKFQKQDGSIDIGKENYPGPLAFRDNADFKWSSQKLKTPSDIRSYFLNLFQGYPSRSQGEAENEYEERVYQYLAFTLKLGAPESAKSMVDKTLSQP